MRIIKGWIPTTVLAATMLFGSLTAQAGIITAGLTSGDGTSTGDPCTVETKATTKVDSGIITAGYTGIIVVDFSSKEPVNCGIITAG